MAQLAIKPPAQQQNAAKNKQKKKKGGRNNMLHFLEGPEIEILLAYFPGFLREIRLASITLIGA